MGRSVDELQVLFRETVETKRALQATQKKFDSLKDEWKREAEAQSLPNGMGFIMVIEETGNGVKFSKKKGSPSATKLKEAGVDAEVIENSRGEYTSFDLV